MKMDPEEERAAQASVTALIRGICGGTAPLGDTQTCPLCLDINRPGRTPCCAQEKPIPGYWAIRSSDVLKSEHPTVSVLCNTFQEIIYITRLQIFFFFFFGSLSGAKAAALIRQGKAHASCLKCERGHSIAHHSMNKNTKGHCKFQGREQNKEGSQVKP